MPPKPHYEPTPEQIAAECAKIRAENEAQWTGGGSAPHMLEPPKDKKPVRKLIDRRKRLSK